MPSAEPSAADALTNFSARTRLLIVAPHPDDETIANGLLIQQVRAAGGEVGIVLLTDGDNNPWPQRWVERRLYIGAGERRRWGARRRAELLQAMQRLGVPATALQQLHWPDLGVTSRLLSTHQAAVAALTTTITTFRPDIVVAPALGDRHPDHGSAHVLARLALTQMPSAPALLTYMVHGPQSGAPTLRLEGAPAEQAAKRFALSAHHSQLVLSGGRVQRLSGRAEQFFVVPRPDGGLPWRPPAVLHPWLRLSLVDAAGAHTWRWHEAPLQRSDAGGYQLSSRHGEPVASPRFARLSLAVPSPWIFDHWGWCEV
ncbi:GlcNAc-PI de-N-acetylase [Rhodanobacter sp. Root480]|jgi:LmbE family N-acetylglucosaminyl deacetylase|uniref:PIG-L deacetylase family protein n=1 Tax=Rhodanobacter sp. Root480 TaxID=1736542 RepID=UPI0006FD5007|nr:PIG-L family deacetylase [Rhodanobacter sp. Root480]KQX99797.1 GlcNAc-PI de-N-acetylase [Rhodanobacter sp. Root480]